MTSHLLFINGEYRDCASGKRIAQTNPATEEIFSEVAAAGMSELEVAVQGAHDAFTREWRDLTPRKRTDVLFNIARGIRSHAEELAQLECRNIGKPIGDARDEIELGARIFEYYAGGVTRLFGQTIPVGRGGFDFTLRQPMGVVSAIVPWNFPFPISCWKAAPALAAGNTVVLKPASQSPLTALLLGRIAAEAGLPSGALQVLSGQGSEIGDALATLAAKDLKRVSLELGGKSPNIVFADCDLAQAVTSSPMSVFANTGQDCCARSRIFVERKIFDKFVDQFVAATRKLQVGDPTRDTTQVGPLVSGGQRKSVEEFIDSARNRKIACGGSRPQAKGAFLEPTVVLDVETTDRVWRDEVFGPVVCIRPFDEEAAMLREVNDSPYGLSGSIWTNDLKRAIRVARAVESGVLSINSHSSVHVEAPFGGFKQSGIGRDLGMAALEGYTEVKNVYVAD
jgi:betaine-aldehyde dehydrogenase